MRDSRYDCLFEPVKVGPLTVRNRFWQVPHCSGMGYRYPNAEARMRGIKAEGGWGVVSTQEAEIHPSSDITPANEARIWSDADLPALRAMTEAVHEHGALAAIQLAHNGLHAANRYSRLPAMGPSHAAFSGQDPLQARAMDKADIARLRRWYVDAARRSVQAGFDIVYVYAGHDMTVLHHFLSRRHNHRSDEYGGSFENRLRLFREVMADVREAIGHRCALAVRLAVDELLGEEGITCEGEGRDIIAALAEEPDVWDVNLSDWSNDSQSARFSDEGFQEPYIRFVKQLTTKPVVGVGRYTSPDSMVRVIRQGIMDFIGAARPSIADPFLPRKIEEGRIDEIRECIGCNICTSGDNTCVPMRCTQNPTMGEEWRRGWHPERIAPLKAATQVLVVGGGPAGLEAARALAQRGASVSLAEAGEQWGGRVSRESALPGLATWARVRDWRLGALKRSPQVEMFLGSRLSADDVLGFGVAHVALATGSRWRADGVGRAHRLPLPYLNAGPLYTPDDLMDGQTLPEGPVVVWDDDSYYMGSVMAEAALRQGREVALVTPDPIVASFTQHTLEQERIQAKLLHSGVRLFTCHRLAGRSADALEIACTYTGRRQSIPCASLIAVGARLPEESLWLALQARKGEWAAAGLESVTRIGDCLAPSTIAAANHAGHSYARELGEAPGLNAGSADEGFDFLREDVVPLQDMRRR
jgi:dimethylamine/trimethylamine dehydrogenase